MESRERVVFSLIKWCMKHSPVHLEIKYTRCTSAAPRQTVDLYTYPYVSIHLSKTRGLERDSCGGSYFGSTHDPVASPGASRTPEDSFIIDNNVVVHVSESKRLREIFLYPCRKITLTINNTNKTQWINIYIAPDTPTHTTSNSGKEKRIIGLNRWYITHILVFSFQYNGICY